MPKRATSTTQSPGAMNLKQKRTRPSGCDQHVLHLQQCQEVNQVCRQKQGFDHDGSRGMVPESPVKNLPAQNHSPACKGGGKPSQRGHSRNRNGLAKTVSPDPRGKQSSKKGEPGNDGSVDNGGTLEVFFDARNIHSASSSSSSTAGHPEAKDISLEAKHPELCVCTDGGSKLPCDHGDMLSSGETFSEDSQAVKVAPSLLPEVVPDDPQGVEALLPELVDAILGRLGPMREVMKLRPELGKAFRNAIHRPAFLRNRPGSEGEFSPTFFMTDNEGNLHWHGFDTVSRKWTRLPSLNFAEKVLPSPDPDLFKDYLVAGDGGLLCINVGKATGREKLVMCNPLTQQVKVLPPLNYGRHPVLMHLKVDDSTGHYKVFVAGSAAIGTEDLSLKTEEYDSRKGAWECPEGSDLPCPPFGLNEYQNGVYFKDSERELLMCVAIVDTRGRGVLVYDITKKKWAQGTMKLHIPLVRSEPNFVSHLATAQIVECGGSVFVFSEQERGWDVYSVIHKLIPEGSGEFTWDEVMRRKRTDGRVLLVHPEFTCFPVSEHELCIFNTIDHTIEVIDLNNPTEVTPVGAAPPSKGNRFHSLNPIGFVFKPSFLGAVCPRGRNVEWRCGLKLNEYCSECEGRGSDSFIRSGVPMDGSQVLVSVPTEETTDTSRNLVESRGSEPEKLIEYAGKVCEDIHNFLNELPEP